MKKIGVLLFVSILFISLVIAGKANYTMDVKVNTNGSLDVSNVVNRTIGIIKGTDDGVDVDIELREGVKNQLLNRTQIQDRVDNGTIYRKNVTFIPWQKRNESECIEGCECHGAVMSCRSESGKNITISAGSSGKTIIIAMYNTTVTTDLAIEQEISGNGTKLAVKLSNGKKAAIKVMPDSAADIALERLRTNVCSSINNCTIELKEVDKEEGARAAYDIQVMKNSRVLWIFKKEMLVRAEIDAETGNAEVDKPWWAFIANE